MGVLISKKSLYHHRVSLMWHDKKNYGKHKLKNIAFTVNLTLKKSKCLQFTVNKRVIHS